MKKHIRFLLFCGACSVLPIWSIPQESAYFGAGVTGALTGMAVYRLFDRHSWLSIPAVGVGGLLGYLFFNKFTPAGRIERAENELAILTHYCLAQRFFTTEDQLLDAVNGAYFSYSWPLVTAFNDYTWYMSLSEKIVGLADAAQRENSVYTARAERIKKSAYDCSINMNNAVKMIRKSKDYIVQLGQFKEEQRHREQLQIQQSMAAAQWSNSQAQHQIAASQEKLVAIKQQQQREQVVWSPSTHHTIHVTEQPTVSYSTSVSGGSVNMGAGREIYTDAAKQSAQDTVSYSGDRDGMLTEREAHDYIAQNIAALERALREHMHAADVSLLKKSVERTIRSAQYAYQHSSYFEAAGKRYKRDIVNQFISSAVLEYIENTSYTYAYNRTQDKTLALRISESMRNNVLALIAQNSVINFERLVPFVGVALERAVNDTIKQLKQVAPVQPQTLQHSGASSTQSTEKRYPSKTCCICLEDFGGSVVQIYLSPCGHDMCKGCASEYFIKNTGNNATCPHCRASVNVNKLPQDIKQNIR